jgi:hypothetical protein
MGKRSEFARRDRDDYPTPFKAVPPLVPWLRGIRTFAEPCAGEGMLVRHLEAHGLRCVHAGDIVTGQDALATGTYGNIDAIITNPPWKRPVLHALIPHFARARCQHAQCGRLYQPQRSSSRFCSDACRQRAHRHASTDAQQLSVTVGVTGPGSGE